MSTFYHVGMNYENQCSVRQLKKYVFWDTWQIAQKDIQAFDRWLWPSKCELCQSNAEQWQFACLCCACWSHVYHPNPPARFKRGTLLLSAQDYTSFWRKHLILAKFKQNLSSYEILYHAIMLSLGAVKRFDPDGIVLVPSHTFRSVVRGGNMLLHFAHVMSEALQVPILDKALLRIRNTPRQSKIIGKAARRANVQGAFEASPEVSQKKILLIDDVCTTGATLRSGVAALKAQSPKQVVCYSILRSPLEV